MRNDKLIEELQRLPNDYEVCLSAYLIVHKDDLEDMPMSEDEAIQMGNNENIEVVFSDPIIGIAINDKDKEIRFVLESSDEDVIDHVDGDIIPIEEERVDEANFNWNIIEKLAQKNEKVFIGDMFILWGYEKDEAVQQLIKFQELAQQHGLAVEPGGPGHENFVYVKKVKK